MKKRLHKIGASTNEDVVGGGGIFSLLVKAYVSTHQFTKRHFTIVTLSAILVMTMGLKIYCSLDNFLHEWDERYHALVAKNLLAHPLKPTLYEHPLEPYEISNWQGNHIWLSKPPLPLWFMAISLKIFGLHEFSIRIPALIFATLSVLLTFLIAKKLFGNSVGLIAAALHGMHGMHTDLASGRLSSDGVETCFLFFVSLGMYCVFRKKPQQFDVKDYIITGLATGLAIMCKWQPALLVLVVMFVYHFSLSHWKKHLLLSTLSLASAALIFMPWVLYIAQSYPQEAVWMFGALFNPFSDTTLNTDGTWYSYLTDYGNLFGYSTFALLALFIWQLSKANAEKNSFKQLCIALLTWALLPLMLFSMAEVKRGTYLFISAPALFILIAWFVIQFEQHRFYLKKAATLLAYTSIIFIAGYSLEKLYLFRPAVRNKTWCDEIKNKDYPAGAVLYNEPHSIELMFYHNVTAYPFAQHELSLSKIEP